MLLCIISNLYTRIVNTCIIVPSCVCCSLKWPMKLVRKRRVCANRMGASSSTMRGQTDRVHPRSVTIYLTGRHGTLARGCLWHGASCVQSQYSRLGWRKMCRASHDTYSVVYAFIGAIAIRLTLHYDRLRAQYSAKVSEILPSNLISL